MKKARWSILAVIIVLIGLLLASTSAAKGPEKIWVVEFTHDVPDGFWTEGDHSYWYEVSWTYPDPDGYPRIPWEDEADPYVFTVDKEAPLYPGRALIRFGYGVVRMPAPGTHCEDLAPLVLHPDQPTRFHLGWPADWAMTYPEAKAHFASMTVTVHWDVDWDGEGPGGSATMVANEIFPMQPGDGFEHVWPNQLCNWTARP